MIDRLYFWLKPQTGQRTSAVFKACSTLILSVKLLILFEIIGDEAVVQQGTDLARGEIGPIF